MRKEACIVVLIVPKNHTMVSLASIQDFASEIARRYSPEKIILFGSQARGDATEDSDVDMLVIMDYEGMRAKKTAEIVCSIDPDFAVDLLIRSPMEVSDRLRVGDYFMQDMLDEGRLLYERGNTAVA